MAALKSTICQITKLTPTLRFNTLAVVLPWQKTASPNVSEGGATVAPQVRSQAGFSSAERARQAIGPDNDTRGREDQPMVSFTISPLTDHTGAEITGLDFTQPIDIDTVAALQHTFAEHHVLVMRDQHFGYRSSSKPLLGCSASFIRTTRKSATSPD